MNANRAAMRLLASVLLLAGGCGESATQRAQRQLVGKWKGDLAEAFQDSFKGSTGDNSLAGALAKTLLEAAKPTLDVEFKADGTMQSSGSFLSESVNHSGTWRVTKVEGNVITISGKQDKETNETESQITLVDKNTIRFIPPADSKAGNVVTLRRATTP